jgi:hypothetical protein
MGWTKRCRVSKAGNKSGEDCVTIKDECNHELVSFRDSARDMLEHLHVPSQTICYH